jgi:hypothetical protein
MNVVLLAFVAVLLFFFPIILVDFSVIGSSSAIMLVACWFLSLCTLGSALYSLRTRYRLAYGIIELIIAIIIVFATMIDVLNRFPSSSDLIPLLTNTALPLIVALYVFVRGMDNIGEGLKTYPAIAQYWTSFFPSRHEVSGSLIGRMEAWLRQLNKDNRTSVLTLCGARVADQRSQASPNLRSRLQLRPSRL